MCMESSKALEQNRGFIQHSVDSNDGKRLVELLSLFLSLSSCECSILGSKRVRRSAALRKSVSD
jgi:hypothetical protein